MSVIKYILRILRRLEYGLLDRLHNLWRWFPIIWNDQDWDFHFTFEILKFKLTNVANRLESNNRYEGVERDVERIRLCIKLIDLVQTDHYQMQAYEFSTDSNIEAYLDSHKSTTIKVLTNKKHRVYPNDNRNAVAMNVGIYKHQQAKKILFSILERYIEYWWE